MHKSLHRLYRVSLWCYVILKLSHCPSVMLLSTRYWASSVLVRIVETSIRYSSNTCSIKMLLDDGTILLFSWESCVSSLFKTLLDCSGMSTQFKPIPNFSQIRNLSGSWSFHSRTSFELHRRWTCHHFWHVTSNDEGTKPRTVGV